MEWEIIPFVGMGPIKFGMTPDQVSRKIGQPESTDIDHEYRREYRDVETPIISYEDGIVAEIEAFYDVKKVSFRGLDIFSTDGGTILSFLERQNMGAEISVGVVLFRNIGVTTGRLDEATREEYSVTAFCKGLWDDRLNRFKTISFA